MKSMILSALAGLTLLAACDVTHPVAVVGNGTVFRGTATTSFEQGGWFQASNGNVSCRGRFTPRNEIKTVSFPVSCNNGLKGIGTATYTHPREGTGEIVMTDGSRWTFLFGRHALEI